MTIPRLLMIFMLPIIAGCGTGEYDALVRERMQKLKSENVVTPIEWGEFPAEIGVAIDTPATPEVKNSQQGNATAQELTMEGGGMSFRAVFMRAPSVDAKRLAETSEKQFQEQGFVETERRESGQRFIYEMINMQNPETGEEVMIRGYQIAPDKGSVLTVTGRRITSNADALRFLESVRPFE